jgi:adenylate kinase
MIRMVLLGAPGSGKGTQAQRLKAKHGVPQISSGDLLRDGVARGTELGLKAKAAMDAGQLVSDDIVLGLIRERLGRDDASNGFVLDGFPRTIDQAEALDRMLAPLNQQLDVVLLLDVKRETLVQRLAGRRTCPNCGHVYNVYFSPSSIPDHCDRCPDHPVLVQRADDKEDVIKKRLEVYDAQTRPLIDHYRSKGLLRVVAGEGPLDEVFARMESAALHRADDAAELSDKIEVTAAPNKKPRAAASKAKAEVVAKKAAPKKKPVAKKTAARKSGSKKSAKAKVVARSVTRKKTTKKKVVAKTKTAARKKIPRKAKPAARKVARSAKSRSKKKARSKK